MKTLKILILLLGFSGVVFGQEKADTTWKRGGAFKLTGTNVGLFNWAAGGSNTVAIGAGINLFANWKKDKETWDNTVDLNYGVISQAKDLNVWFKNDDRIEFNSKYGRKRVVKKKDKVTKWYYTALFNFRSQFAPGFANVGDTIKISDFMSPGYTMLAIGMDYKPDEHFSLFLSPLTMKGTYVFDQNLADAGAFGVDKAEYDDLGELVKAGSNSRFELGGYLKLGYQKKFSEDKLFLKTGLDLFSNYIDNPQNIDVNWTADMSYQMNKYLGVTLSTILIYDDDIDVPVFDSENVQIGTGPRTQFKYVFGVGLTYQF